MIFDVHAHYDDEKFDEDRFELIERLHDTYGVCGIINAAVDIASARASLDLADQYPFIKAAVGIHPENAEKADNDAIEQLKELCTSQNAVAIGEIGLDYHYGDVSRECQLRIFEGQLALAKTINMPVVIHDRVAHADTLRLLKKYCPKGILHCYSGSVEMLKEVLKTGMAISLGGVVTFKNAKTAVAVADAVPMDRLLLETDAPYMAPVPLRGHRCDSSHIKYTAERIAQIKNLSLHEVLSITRDNANRIFSLSL